MIAATGFVKQAVSSFAIFVSLRQLKVINAGMKREKKKSVKEPTPI